MNFNLNIILFAFLSVIEGLQAVFIAGLVSSIIPIPWGEFEHTLFPIAQARIKPEREILIFRIFILISIGVQTACVSLFRRRLDDTELRKAIVRTMVLDGILVGVQFFAAFKIFLYQDPFWARGILYAAMGTWVLTKIFWQNVDRWLAMFSAKFETFHMAYWRGFILWAPLALVASLIVIVDRQQGLGLIDAADRFALWKRPGFFSDGDWLRLLSIMAAVYVMVYGWMVYRWSGRVTIALFAAALFTKLNLFHSGQFPLCWHDPSQTMLRSPFDLLFFYFIWRHIQQGKLPDLRLSALTCACAAIYRFDTGAFLMIAYMVYIVLLVLWHRAEGDDGTFAVCHRHLRRVVLMVLLIAAGYWAKGLRIDQIILNWQMFQSGWDALPVYAPLKTRHFFSFIVAYLVPVLYLWTMAVVGQGLWLKRRAWKDVLVVIIAVYGLAYYHDFIYRSSTAGYYTGAAALVVVLAFWLDACIVSKAVNFSRRLWTMLAVLSMGALLTNNLVFIYPNVFNMRSAALNAVKAAYLQKAGHD